MLHVIPPKGRRYNPTARDTTNANVRHYFDGGWKDASRNLWRGITHKPTKMASRKKHAKRSAPKRRSSKVDMHWISSSPSPTSMTAQSPIGWPVNPTKSAVLHDVKDETAVQDVDDTANVSDQHVGQHQSHIGCRSDSVLFGSSSSSTS